MSAIVLLDTSVYLNVLDVPGRNQWRIAILDEFAIRVENEDIFLLPMATIWETGNHVARLPNGDLRRRFAQRLVDDVTKALDERGVPPYQPTHFPERRDFLGWLTEFPNHAQRNKEAGKPGEGMSLADFSIMKEWERTCTLHPMSRVLIWSLDADLSAYDRKPR